MNLNDLIKSNIAAGLSRPLAEARVCQDVILSAIASGPLNRNVAIKGGVVMRSISRNLRRSTRDLDFDFIRYSLDDSAIESFIRKLNCIEGIEISIISGIEELKHQDYHGKRVHISVSDEEGTVIKSKLDIGVHKHLEIEQEDYCFDLCLNDGGASLLINSKEQIFIEKLRSLLVFGPNSNRYKDVYDLYYLKEYTDIVKLNRIAGSLIFDDVLMRENTWEDVLRRISATFSDRTYVRHLSESRQRWIDEDLSEILNSLLVFFSELS